jgi:hypothetical protein
MNEPLRPSSLGEILDRTAQLYRSRFLMLLGISAIPTGAVLVLACVVALVVAWWSAAGAASVSSDTGYVLVAVFAIAAALVALPVYLAVTALATAAMNHAASRVHLGKAATIRDAYKTVWRRGWRYIGLYLLEALVIWIAPFTVWFVLVLVSATGAALAQKAGIGAAAGVLLPLLAFLVFAILAGYVILMLLQLSLAFPACVVEQIGAWPALKRSSALSKETKGRIFLLYLLGAALSWLLSMGVVLVLTILLYLIPGINSAQHARAAGLAVIFVVYGSMFAVQALVKPVYGIALVLFYYDQRIRQEGFDIEWMMQQAGMVPAQPAPETAPWLPPVQGIVQVAENGNFLQYDQRIRHEGYGIERMMDSAGMIAPVTPTSDNSPAVPAEAGEGHA